MSFKSSLNYRLISFFLLITYNSIDLVIFVTFSQTFAAVIFDSCLLLFTLC
jgi:hypothetical protein